MENDDWQQNFTTYICIKFPGTFKFQTNYLNFKHKIIYKSKPCTLYWVKWVIFMTLYIIQCNVPILHVKRWHMNFSWKS